MKILTALLIGLLPLATAADVVVPADTVENYVNIRKAPDASAEVVGRLGQGDAFELVSSPDGWYEVQLDDDVTGFVSADWAEVRAVAVETVPEELAAEEAEETDVAIDEAIGTEIADEVTAAVNEEIEVEVQDELTEAVAEEIKVEVQDEVIVEVSEQVGADATDVVADQVAEAEAEVVEEAVVIEVNEEADAAATPPEPAPEVHEPVDPPAPAVVAGIDGDVNFLARFRKENELGNSQVYDDGNKVGIGTTEPEQRLDVNGSVQIHDRNSNLAGLIITQSAGDSGYIMHNRAGTLTIGAGSQDRITIDRDGNVGIATAKPEHPLEMASGAHVTAGGVWTNRSSRDSKQDIARLSEAEAAQALMKLEPVTFSYVNESGENYVGFIAEDVPELVASSDRSSLSTMDIVAVLTKVVQAQQRKIEELEARLESR